MVSDISRHKGSGYHFHEEPHRPFLINAISSGALPRLTFLSIEDTDSHVNLVLEAFRGCAVDARGVGIDDEGVCDDIDEEAGEAEEPGALQCRHHQTMIKRPVVRITMGNHRGISDVLEMPHFGSVSSFSSDMTLQSQGFRFFRSWLTYIRRTPGFAPCLRHLSFEIPCEDPTFGPLLPLFEKVIDDLWKSKGKKRKKQ